MKSWWDILPEEIQLYILKLRDKMYRDEHKVYYKKVIDDLETIGMIKGALKLEFVKIVCPSRKRCMSEIKYPGSEICPVSKRMRRRVTGYFKDPNNITREIRLASCICQITEDNVTTLQSRIQEQGTTCRIPLFYDEWRDPRFYRGTSRLIDPDKVAHLRAIHKRRKEKKRE